MPFLDSFDRRLLLILGICWVTVLSFQRAAAFSVWESKGLSLSLLMALPFLEGSWNWGALWFLLASLWLPFNPSDITWSSCPVNGLMLNKYPQSLVAWNKIDSLLVMILSIGWGVALLVPPGVPWLGWKRQAGITLVSGSQCCQWPGTPQFSSTWPLLFTRISWGSGGGLPTVFQGGERPNLENSTSFLLHC